MKERDQNAQMLDDMGFYEGSNLTVKQQRFVLSYIKNEGDRLLALKDAGYSTSNENTASVAACKILANPTVKKYIKKIRSDMEENFKVGAEYLLRRHKKIIDDLVPMDENTRCDPFEVRAAQASMDGICKMEGLYAAEKRTLEVTEVDPDIELAKKYAQENLKEF
jgi:hypothetical protein